MKIINYSDFRANLSENLNAVNDDKDVIVVSRSGGKNAVLVDMDEYNSMQETIHLLSTSTNRKRLFGAIEEMNAGKSIRHKLIKSK